MKHLLDQDIEPILDPLHHTSWPVWLSDGFKDKRFVPSYLAFFRALVERYPQVTKYTIVHEPYVTALFCGQIALWSPFSADEKVFITMLGNLAQVITILSNELAHMDKNHWYIDSCEESTALDAESEDLVKGYNNKRFLLLDLVLGKVDTNHPLYYIYRDNDIDPEQFVRNPAIIHCLGLDYYNHSELNYAMSQRCTLIQVKGFAEVAYTYAMRYRLPIMLGETNIYGHYMGSYQLLECIRLEESFLSLIIFQCMVCVGFCLLTVLTGFHCSYSIGERLIIKRLFHYVMILHEIVIIFLVTLWCKLQKVYLVHLIFLVIDFAITGLLICKRIS